MNIHCFMILNMRLDIISVKVYFTVHQVRIKDCPRATELATIVSAKL